MVKPGEPGQGPYAFPAVPGSPGIAHTALGRCSGYPVGYGRAKKPEIVTRLENTITARLHHA
jgi:hypothetical protein